MKGDRVDVFERLLSGQVEFGREERLARESNGKFQTYKVEQLECYRSLLVLYTLVMAITFSVLIYERRWIQFAVVLISAYVSYRIRKPFEKKMFKGEPVVFRWKPSFLGR